MDVPNRYTPSYRALALHAEHVNPSQIVKGVYVGGWYVFGPDKMWLSSGPGVLPLAFPPEFVEHIYTLHFQLLRCVPSLC